MSRWIPWLGILLCLSCGLAIFDRYSTLHAQELYESRSILQYGPFGAFLILGVLTCFCRSPGIRAWGSIAVMVTDFLLQIPWSARAQQMALTTLGSAGYIAFLIGASGLLGASAPYGSEEMRSALWIRRFGAIATGAIGIHMLVNGTSIVLSWSHSGVPSWSSLYFFLDSLLLLVSFGLLAWACIETWRPAIEPRLRIRRVFRAMILWLMSFGLHVAHGLYLSLAVFKSSLVPAVSGALPVPLWVLIFAISVSQALDRQESNNLHSG